MPWLLSEGLVKPEIDHDHECCPGRGRTCGKCNRALLCTDCNRMIGWSRDNADRLMAGAAYVLQWKGVVSGAVAFE
jgi:Recombination endonuclease VII